MVTTIYDIDEIKEKRKSVWGFMLFFLVMSMICMFLVTINILCLAPMIFFIGLYLTCLMKMTYWDIKMTIIEVKNGKYNK